LLADGFDWDDGNRLKCSKHGVPIEDIEYVMRNAPLVAPDYAHSRHEDRYIAIGRSRHGRSVFVAFTYRHRNGHFLVRPISARYMHAKEIARHGRYQS